MDKKIFKTLIRKDHKLGGNKYVYGVVNGIRFAICEDGESIPFGNGEIDEGRIVMTRCTPEVYEQFTKKVEEVYPGLCIFYYEEESK